MVPEPCILYPVGFAAPAPVIRAVVDGVEMDVVLTGIVAGELAGWFVAEDSLLVELVEAFDDAGATVTATLDDDNMLTLESDVTLELLWTHVNTTLDPTLLGWTDAADTASATTLEAPNQTRGIWIPGVPGDPRGFLERTPHTRKTAAVWTPTLDGRGRGYDLSPDPDNGRVSWYRIPGARVAPELALSTQPYCTFEEAWTTGGLAAGEVFRLYDDRTDRATFRLYQVTNAPQGTPWELEAMDGTIRYEIGPLELVEVE